MNNVGELVRARELRLAIYHGGVEPQLRKVSIFRSLQENYYSFDLFKGRLETPSGSLSFTFKWSRTSGLHEEEVRGVRVHEGSVDKTFLTRSSSGQGESCHQHDQKRCT
jgi:hypothetical protein